MMNIWWELVKIFINSIKRRKFWIFVYLYRVSSGEEKLISWIIWKFIEDSDFREEICIPIWKTKVHFISSEKGSEPIVQPIHHSSNLLLNGIQKSPCIIHMNEPISQIFPNMSDDWLSKKILEIIRNQHLRFTCLFIIFMLGKYKNLEFL